MHITEIMPKAGAKVTPSIRGAEGSFDITCGKVYTLLSDTVKEQWPYGNGLTFQPQVKAHIIGDRGYEVWLNLYRFRLVDVGALCFDVLLRDEYGETFKEIFHALDAESCLDKISAKYPKATALSVKRWQLGDLKWDN